jgi:16S rRNA (uracil1498-N3)-methyltransferase
MRTLLAPAPLTAGPVSLSKEEAHHGRSVLRLDEGDDLRLCDGAGSVGLARVTAIGRHSLDCEVAEVSQPQPPAARLLTVAVAPPKGSRFEDLVRALTELGVGAIHCIETERSVRQPNLERAQRVAGEALKQCRGAHLPSLRVGCPLPLSDENGGELVILDPQGGPAAAGAPRATTLVIGPEGGLTDEERKRLIAAGASSVRLGGHVLRIETAACAAAAVWATTWEHHGRV